jgi:Nucleoside 2-deoxyribosyltransferase like
MARIIKPPAPLTLHDGERSLFLAGSIEMGAAELWQTEVERALVDEEVVILNPRRDQWDASWEQSIRHPMFREQVEWELSGQELATIIALYFAPTTRAPITLLELGLFAHSGKQVVCCPAGFWRRGNVEIVCGRHGIPMVDSLPALIDLVRLRLKS